MGAAVSRGQLVEPTTAKRTRESKVQQRVQLLEELVQGPTQSRRQQLLKQLTPDSCHGGTQGYFLPSAPEEFKLGCLIAAGSYGRVYAGSYCGSPSALKLLILEEESAAAILNEVRLCLKLNHKNLVRLLDCAVVSTSSWQPATPWASGGNWLSSSPAAASLQPPSPCQYSYLPLLTTPAAAQDDQQQQQQLPGSPTAAAAAAAAGHSVIARASEPHRFTGLITGNDLLSQHDSQQRQLGLVSPAGHACFEVWIAMELCDGGTLAEQVQRGFQYYPESKQVDMELLLLLAIDIARALSYMHSEHVCHGDLKSENVLLKSELPSSFSGSVGCGGASSCFGSSDECSWLGMLCSTASSSTCTSRCRRHSDESCFSCCSGNGNGSSAAGQGGAASSGWCISRQGPGSGSSSTSSSPVSGSRHGHSSRGTAFSRSGNLLSFSGLCCLAPGAACLGEEVDDEPCRLQMDQQQQEQQQQQHAAPASGTHPSCLWSGCSVSEISRHSLDVAGDCAAAADTCLEAKEQQFGTVGDDYAGMGPISGQICSFTPVASSNVSFCQEDVEVFDEAAAAAATPAVQQQQHLDLVSALQAAQQQQQQQLSYECEGIPQRAPYDGGEEEHIAPLSLYNTVREHRRSRRLSQSAMLPNLQAAIAAAAARMQQQQVQGRVCPISNNTTSSSATGEPSDSSRDDTDEISSERNASSHHQQQQQQHGNPDGLLLASEDHAAAASESSSRCSRPASSFFSNPGSVYCSSEASSPGEACTARLAAAAAASSSCTMPTVAEGQPALLQQQQEAELQQQQQQLLGRTATGHDVYARRLPPRARRHSYCYGTSLPWDPRTLLGGFSSTSAPGISATEAATAIAAAAAALKQDNAVRNSGSAAAAAAAGGAPRARRSRRMSCDDRLLLQRHSSLAGSLATSQLQLPLLHAASSESSGNPLFGRVTGLGRPPAALRRTGSGGSSYIDYKTEPLPAAPAGVASGLGFAVSGLSSSSAAAAAAAEERPRRTRRHSWTASDGGAAAAAAEASGLWGLRALTSLLLPQEQQQQQQQDEEADESEAAKLLLGPSSRNSTDDASREGRRASSSQFGSVAGSPQMPSHGALVCCPGLSLPGSGSSSASRRSGRTRRHSWAGFGGVLPDTLFKVEQPAALNSNSNGRSRRGSLSLQSPQRRGSLLSHLPACCGDSGYLPFDDLSTAAGCAAAPCGEAAEDRQPLLPSSQLGGAAAVSDGSSCSFTCGAGSPLDEGVAAVSVSCLGRMLSSSGGGGRQGRRSSWCCSGSAGSSQHYGSLAGDWSVGSGSSGMAALLAAGSFEPSSSVPSMPRGQRCNGRDAGRQGSAGSRCSWDGPRDAAAALVFDSAAAAAAAAAAIKLQQQDQPETARQQQQLYAGAEQPRPCSLGQPVAHEQQQQQQFDCKLGAAGSNALWEMLPLQPAEAAAKSAAAFSTGDGSSLQIPHTELAAEKPAAAAAGAAAAGAAAAAAAMDSTSAGRMPMDVTPSNSSAQLPPLLTPPAAPKPAATLAGPTAAVVAAAAAAAAAAAGAAPSSLMRVGSSSPCMDSPAGLQSVGYNMLFAPSPGGTAPELSPEPGSAIACAGDNTPPATAAAAVSTDSSSCASVDLVQLLGGYGKGHDIPVVAAATPQANPSPVFHLPCIAGSSTATEQQQQQQQQPLEPEPLVGSFGTFGGSSSSRRGSLCGLPAAPQRQLPWQQQQLLGSSGAAGPAACEIQPAGSSISGRPSPQGTLGSSAAEGSFGIMSYGTRASGSSSAARGRRWSTGVAAHDLIARKQALMMPSPGSQLSRDLEGFGSSGPGSGVSSVRCRVSISSKGPDGSLASSLKELQQLIDAHAAPTAAAGAVAAGSAPWAAVGAAARAAPAGPSSYGGGAATATTNSAGLSRLGSVSSRGGCSTMSSGSHQVVNILGMPPKPAAMLNQRRMSYDTATASYTLVSKLEQEQQVLAQQQLLLPQQQVQAVQAGGAAPMQQQEQQQQQDVQQQLQGDVQQQQQPLHKEQQVGDSTPQAQSCADSGSSPAAQQYQAHVQRLVAALAKKGYSTSLLDGSSSGPNGCSSGEQQQQQQQQQGSGGESLGAASAAAVQQLQAQTRARRSSAASVDSQMPRQRYTAKVCDFGFSQCLRAGQSHCSTAAAGTITHQAPEVLLSGHLSPAADIYAFGIILWELLTGESPFRGMLEGDLVVGVCDRKLRPVFPPGAPVAYVALAQQCWADDASERPTAAQLLKRLNELLYEVRRVRALELQQQNSSSAAGSSDSASQCRRRRHSMPVVGSGRQRRMSRRLSLFLPFSRQPAAVPEHEPLEPSSGDGNGSSSAQARVGSGASPVAAAAAAAPPAASPAAAAAAAARARRASGSTSSSSGTHASGSLAAGTGSSTSGHAVRLQALACGNSGAAVGTARTCSATGVGGTAGSCAADADPSTQWFQSFDD
uniref:Protein kinase domain-containing protein n=1 Tax=Tetradesmus obliquus TaxID=3088 RepID=A0A383WJZ4_TETOB|eukprot:jgi/Sobl393_1/10550/SZX77778.1